MRFSFFLSFIAASFLSFCQPYLVISDTITALKGASIRGMSVVDDSVAWISGSKGTVARTFNGGRSWEKIEVKGFEKRDFRSIDAFDRERAFIASAGDSTALLYTLNGGKNWNLLFSLPVKGAFFDAISSWNIDSGLVLSDPVNRMFLLPFFSTTRVNAMQSCLAEEGEACFAASGTCLRTGKDGKVWFVTGGAVSRLFTSHDYGKTWTHSPIPVMQGKPSQGAYSVFFTDDKNGIVVGGDYEQPGLAEKNCFFTKDGGKTWQEPKSPPNGYRSCVEQIRKSEFICTGTSGTDFSKDNGKNWKSIDANSFNVARRAKKGNLVLLAGDKGRVGVLRKK